MYWIYNICLVAYWILQIPILVYRLLFEEGFYERLKQSAGIMPTPTLEKIAYHHAIWVHAASVGEVVAARNGCYFCSYGYWTSYGTTYYS